jgi:hypothetical protein
MPNWAKLVTLLGGAFLGLLIVVQLVFGQRLLAGTADIHIRVAHQHTGYLLSAVGLLYVLWTVGLILRVPSSRSEEK